MTGAPLAVTLTPEQLEELAQRIARHLGDRRDTLSVPESAA
jgi:hypothetical protein